MMTSYEALQYLELALKELNMTEEQSDIIYYKFKELMELYTPLEISDLLITLSFK